MAMPLRSLLWACGVAAGLLICRADAATSDPSRQFVDRPVSLYGWDNMQLREAERNGATVEVSWTATRGKGAFLADSDLGLCVSLEDEQGPLESTESSQGVTRDGAREAPLFHFSTTFQLRATNQALWVTIKLPAAGLFCTAAGALPDNANAVAQNTWRSRQIRVRVEDRVLPRSAEKDIRARCLQNLRQVNIAKDWWAMEKGHNPGEEVPPDEIRHYLKHDPSCTNCPAGGKISIGRLGEPAKCSLHGP